MPTTALYTRSDGIVAWQGTVHPFVRKPSWETIAELSWEEQRAHLLDPAFKAKLIAEASLPAENVDEIRTFSATSAARN